MNANEILKRLIREVYSRPMLCDRKTGIGVPNDVEPLECTCEELRALEMYGRACAANGADFMEPGQFGPYNPHFMGIPIKVIE